MEVVIIAQPLLDVKDLKTYFYVAEGTVKAADGIEFAIYPQESFGIVGETGCGKSVTGLSIMRLVISPGKIVGGQVNFKGRNLLGISVDEMQKVNGNEISMIFQDPMTSLNPTITVGEQVAETIWLHQQVTEEEAWEKAIEVLRTVGIPQAERRALDYPHQFSGGMRQRVLIAIALACNPALIIADEPTSALDVTIQAQILELIRKLKESFGTSLMMITHDLGVIAETTSRMAVLYAGRVVEIAETQNIFEDPTHPYTRGLMASIPGLQTKEGKMPLRPIEGNVPDLIRMPSGCTFHPRCPYKVKKCLQKYPPTTEPEPGHFVACWQFG